jgi:putative Mg2+ transporter-C (MgtC) family protein
MSGRNLPMPLYLEITVRLLLAGILGGIVGYEREHTHRPAGFRTHILVCVGSALVMITSEFIFEKYHSLTNADPARLGAQIISGIGFLGAGTIIRDGFNVKGLTTAASLWAVSCVGIATGIGFYSGAILATVLIFITLIVLKKMEIIFPKKNRYKTIYVESDNRPGQIGHISCVFDKHDTNIRNIEFINNENDKFLVKLISKTRNNLAIKGIMSDLQEMPGIRKVYDE